MSVKSNPVATDINLLMSQIEAADPTRTQKGKSGRRTKEASEWVRQNSITAARPSAATWDIDPSLPPVVFVYERISSLHDDSDTFERQRKGILELASREGIDLTDAIFLGEEMSAYHFKHRPEFDKMIKTIEAYKGQNQIIVIASELTRLFRNRDVAYRVMSVLRAKKVKLRICNNPSLDILNPNFDMVLPVLIEVAQGEAASTAYRTEGAHAVRAKRGEYRGGTVPYGMTTEKRQNDKGVKSYLCPVVAPNDLFPAEIKVGVDELGNAIMSPNHIKHEGDLVREIFVRYCAGDSLTDIALWINDNKFPTAKQLENGSWCQQSVRRILLNPQYTGRVVHKGKVVQDDNGDDLIVNTPLITDETYSLAKARIETRYKHTPRRRSYRLSGMLVCGSCGHRMSGRPGSETSNRSYGCRYHYVDKANCSDPNFIIADGIEQFFYDFLSEMAEQRPDVLVELGSRAEVIDANAGKRAELQATLAELDEKYAAETSALSREGIKHMRGIVAKQISDLDADAYAAMTLAKVAFEGAAQFKQAWESDNRSHLMLALRTIIDKVVITPANQTKKMNWKSLAKAGWTTNLHRITIHWANGTVMNMAEVDTTKAPTTV